MRQNVLLKTWFTIFKVKVTARAYIIEIWLSPLFIINRWSTCNQTCVILCECFWFAWKIEMRVCHDKCLSDYGADHCPKRKRSPFLQRLCSMRFSYCTHTYTHMHTHTHTYTHTHACTHTHTRTHTHAHTHTCTQAHSMIQYITFSLHLNDSPLHFIKACQLIFFSVTWQSPSIHILKKRSV